jgi:hypothetical protein
MEMVQTAQPFIVGTAGSIAQCSLLKASEPKGKQNVPNSVEIHKFYAKNGCDVRNLNQCFRQKKDFWYAVSKMPTGLNRSSKPRHVQTCVVTHPHQCHSFTPCKTHVTPPVASLKSLSVIQPMVSPMNGKFLVSPASSPI